MSKTPSVNKGLAVMFSAPLHEFENIQMLVNVPIPVYYPDFFKDITVVKNKLKKQVVCTMVINEKNMSIFDFDEVAGFFIDKLPMVVMYLKNIDGKPDEYVLRRTKYNIGARPSCKKSNVVEAV